MYTCSRFRVGPIGSAQPQYWTIYISDLFSPLVHIRHMIVIGYVGELSVQANTQAYGHNYRRQIYCSVVPVVPGIRALEKSRLNTKGCPIIASINCLCPE